MTNNVQLTRFAVGFMSAMYGRMAVPLTPMQARGRPAELQHQLQCIYKTQLRGFRTVPASRSERA
jgi:hypothetical protein